MNSTHHPRLRRPPLPALVAPCVVAAVTVVALVSEGYMVAVGVLLGATIKPAVEAIHDNYVESDPMSAYARAMRALARRRNG